MPKDNEHCHNCDIHLPTELIELRPDLIGRCCHNCHACRKGRPYATLAEWRAYKNGQPVELPKECPALQSIKIKADAVRGDADENEKR